MKRTILAMAFIVFLGISLVCFTTAGQYGDYGGGWTTNATTTALSINFGTDIMKTVSIFVNGGSTQVVYAMPDCAPVTLATAVSNNTALPIRGGLAYTFTDRAMTNICIQAMSGIGSPQVDIAARRQ